jgi:DNA-binding XRE family transcriptional regulator
MMEDAMAIPADDVFAAILTPEQRAEADRRGQEMLAQYLTLQQLRKARDLTQVELARTLGKEQVAISQIERRTDMLLSTLRGYVEAMGGNLSLVVQFEDRAPVFLTGIGDEEPSSKPRPVVERPTPA